MCFRPAALACILLAVSCSRDSGTLPSEASPPALELEMMPLAEGAIWTYDFYMTESATQSSSEGRRLTLTKTYGRMLLSVPREVASGFTRSWQLKSVIEVDSIFAEDYLDYVLTGVSESTNPFTWTSTYSILFEHDTLWYSDNGVLSYMMPGRFAPGGTVDLKIFNYPGTDFFLQPLPYSSRWASGDMVFLRQNQTEQSAVKIGGYEGVLGVWAASRDTDTGNLLERELRFTLSDPSSSGHD